jgi:hypothetical protein
MLGDPLNTGDDVDPTFVDDPQTDADEVPRDEGEAEAEPRVIVDVQDPEATS